MNRRHIHPANAPRRAKGYIRTYIAITSVVIALVAVAARTSMYPANRNTIVTRSETNRPRNARIVPVFCREFRENEASFRSLRRVLYRVRGMQVKRAECYANLVAQTVTESNRIRIGSDRHVGIQLAVKASGNVCIVREEMERGRSVRARLVFSGIIRDISQSCETAVSFFLFFCFCFYSSRRLACLSSSLDCVTSLY